MATSTTPQPICGRIQNSTTTVDANIGLLSSEDCSANPASGSVVWVTRDPARRATEYIDDYGATSRLSTGRLAGFFQRFRVDSEHIVKRSGPRVGAIIPPAAR